MLCATFCMSHSTFKPQPAERVMHISPLVSTAIYLFFRSLWNFLTQVCFCAVLWWCGGQWYLTLARCPQFESHTGKTNSSTIRLLGTGLELALETIHGRARYASWCCCLLLVIKAISFREYLLLILASEIRWLFSYIYEPLCVFVCMLTLATPPPPPPNHDSKALFLRINHDSKETMCGVRSITEMLNWTSKLGSIHFWNNREVCWYE